MKKTIKEPPLKAFEFIPGLDDPEDWKAIQDYENGGKDWISSPNKDYKKQVSIRLPVYTLAKLRELAEKEGLKYQTFINSILIKYVNTH